MQLFYTTNIEGNIAQLPPEEAMHCVKTLRKKVGDAINLVDGKGHFYKGNIIATGKKSCTIAIESSYKERKYRTTHLHIAIAPTKNISRLEWFLEKATEIGIDEITPILCKRSERKNIRLDRLEKVLVAAMKQSLKATVPTINDLTDFESFVNSTASDNKTARFIAHCLEGNNIHLKDRLQSVENTVILIGPEGDFTPEEVDVCLKKSYLPISLGEARLRTETAGIVACHTVNLF